MIKPFLYSWLGYWSLVALLPVHSIYPGVGYALVLQVVFVVLVATAYLATCASLHSRGVPTEVQGQIAGARVIVRISIALSLLGLLFLVYDKVAIQGIDYSDGLAVAREQWKEVGEERDGAASSIWSALGYLTGSAYYVTAVILITQSRRFSHRERLRIAFAVFLFALLNSAISGGRSNFMLLAMFAVSAFSARSDLSVRQIFPSRRQRRIVGAVVLGAMTYVVYVFYARAQASDELVSLYVVNFLPYMGLDFDDWYLGVVGEGTASTVGNMLILVVGYLTHSLATFAAIADVPTEDKVMLFGNAASILYKLGMVAKPDDGWLLAGRFPSLPGAFWHQLGPYGFVAASLALGIASGIATVWAALSSRRLLPLGVFVMCAATLILTPYLFAPDFLSFPFVVAAFVMLAPFASKRSRRQRAGGAIQPSAPVVASSKE